MATYLDSLCWNCSKGANECCFMESLEPVEGWKAKKVLCEGNETYHVIKCPDFEPMREVNGKPPGKKRGKIKVRCVETGQIYPSANQCAKETNYDRSYILKCIHGEAKTFKAMRFEKV